MYDKKSKLSLCIWLFHTNFFISAFTFGGGYVVIPMIRKYFVEKHQYIKEEELMNLAALAQTSPGAIAINLSAVTGFKVLGKLGAVISCIGAVLPPLIIISILSIGYQFVKENEAMKAILKGMEAGVAALIVDVVLDMYRVIRKECNRWIMLLVPITFIANVFLGIGVLPLILGSVFVGFLYGNKRKRGKCL